ncbi:helix-turn-helix domain-containing protein [Diaphorobacter caeni]|uniref:helix-turn-helix domain-containing protein n=1 Tax=Diaphorobacter caeni TaxID=2784387 RepID=UPI00188FFA56|nr:hypothetical protein [Diaphorobacter caeni]MBF5004752.1 hypothetical protein [Diaphorobacter caeni]
MTSVGYLFAFANQLLNTVDSPKFLHIRKINAIIHHCLEVQMARKPRNVDGLQERARVAMSQAKTADELRVAQAVLLPLIGFSLEQAAQVVERDRYWVSRVRNRFIKGQPAVPRQRGGRRNALLQEDEELKLVKLALTQCEGWQSVSLRSELRSLLDERGIFASESTLTKMLSRVAPYFLLGGSCTDLEGVSFHLGLVMRCQRTLAKRDQRAWP